jgi:hypothetical protein
MKIKSVIARTLLFSVVFCASLTTFAQDDLDENKMVGFACFFEGRETKLVSRFAKNLKRKQYDSIKKMLTSENNAERLMAVLCLERLNEVGRVTLHADEKLLIEKIKTSSDLVDVCSGCVPNPSIPLSSVFHSNILWGSTGWLERNIKE